MYLISDPSQNRIGTDPRLFQFREIASEVSKMGQQCYGQFDSSNPLHGEVLRFAFFIGLLAQSEQWSLIAESDFDNLIRPQGPYADAWTKIKFLVPQAEKLQTRLNDLYTEWKKIK